MRAQTGAKISWAPPVCTRRADIIVRPSYREKGCALDNARVDLPAPDHQFALGEKCVLKNCPFHGLDVEFPLAIRARPVFVIENP